jgi:hypothetical protein
MGLRPTGPGAGGTDARQGGLRRRRWLSPPPAPLPGPGGLARRARLGARALVQRRPHPGAHHRQRHRLRRERCLKTPCRGTARAWRSQGTCRAVGRRSRGRCTGGMVPTGPSVLPPLGRHRGHAPGAGWAASGVQTLTRIPRRCAQGQTACWPGRGRYTLRAPAPLPLSYERSWRTAGHAGPTPRRPRALAQRAHSGTVLGPARRARRRHSAAATPVHKHRAAPQAHAPGDAAAERPAPGAAGRGRLRRRPRATGAPAPRAAGRRRPPGPPHEEAQPTRSLRSTAARQPPQPLAALAARGGTGPRAGLSAKPPHAPRAGGRLSLRRGGDRGASNAPA